MRITIGHNAYLKHTQNRIEPVIWDSQTAMNGHIMILGGSGAGKTHQALQLINAMVQDNATGLFRAEAPPFVQHAAVWRYDIKSLREDEQKLLVYFRLEELFQQAVARGVQKDIRQVIFLDEAKRFFTDEADNPINIIATEGRKFGLALVCASQSPTHFSEDFLANVATKILLRLDEMYWDGSVKKLKIELKTLKYIVPKKTLAIQIKTSDAASARFVGVDLDSANSQKFLRAG